MTDDMAIDRSQVLRVGQLARLRLDRLEAERLTRELVGILDYVSKLQELDTSRVAPTSHAIDLPTRWRPDEIRPGLDLEKALHNAPEKIGDGFGVPKIIE